MGAVAELSVRTANAAKVNPRQPILQALAVLALLLAAATPLFAQSVAMVIDVQGEAVTKPASGKPLKLAITTEIAGEATVLVDAGAQLSVLYVTSGDEYQFSGPAQIRFGKAAPQVLSGAPAQKKMGVVRASCTHASASGSKRWKNAGAIIMPIAIVSTGTLSPSATQNRGRK